MWVLYALPFVCVIGIVCEWVCDKIDRFYS